MVNAATGRLSTHVLDVVSGRPAQGVVVELRRLVPDAAPDLLAHVLTNADGRTAGPLLAGDTLLAGTYELTFHIGDYFRSRSTPDCADPPFLDQVPVRFTIADPSANYHVPLLVSPWSYSTYRGS